MKKKGKKKGKAVKVKNSTPAADAPNFDATNGKPAGVGY